ncbi:unnamed protein product, partial [Polarella glacialis]
AGALPQKEMQYAPQPIQAKANCSEDQMQSDLVVPSLRSSRCASTSNLCTPGGPGGGRGIQGTANCSLCHALLEAFAGKLRIQTFNTASSLPAPPQELVDKALALELSEEEEIVASATLCRYHSLHKRRYELWLRGQEAIRRCTTRGDPQAMAAVRRVAEDLAKLEEKAAKVEPEFLESFAAYLKLLQQDVRENLFDTLMGKADELVAAWQSEIDDVDAQISRKIKERRASLTDAIDRCQESAREQFWRQQQKHSAQKFVNVLVDNCKHLQTCKSSQAAQAFRELAVIEQAKRRMTEREVESKVAQKTEREYAKRERAMSIWLSKMDQLQMLQHLQASKDRELVYLRVGMTIRRLEE